MRLCLLWVFVVAAQSLSWHKVVKIRWGIRCRDTWTCREERKLQRFCYAQGSISWMPLTTCNIIILGGDQELSQQLLWQSPLAIPRLALLEPGRCLLSTGVSTVTSPPGRLYSSILLLSVGQGCFCPRVSFALKIWDWKQALSFEVRSLSFLFLNINFIKFIAAILANKVI